MTNSITESEIRFQRCIDGELDENQQLELIQELDSVTTNEGWRELAIQFMEQQVLNDFFSEEKNYRVENFEPKVGAISAEKTQNQFSFSSAIRLTVAIAAGLLLGINLDFFSLQSSIRTAENSNTPTLNLINGTDDVLAETNSALPETSLSSAPTFDIYEYPSNDTFYQDVFLPEDLRQHLAKAGWVIERQSRAYHIPSENGHDIIVPSDTIRVRHVER